MEDKAIQKILREYGMCGEILSEGDICRRRDVGEHTHKKSIPEKISDRYDWHLQHRYDGSPFCTKCGCLVIDLGLHDQDCWGVK